MWLVERLQTAWRGAELLDRKRQALLREQARVLAEAADARREWGQASANVTLWSTRAAMLDGAARLELLARHADRPSSLVLSWQNLMGARLPSIERVDAPEPPPVSALGASSATVLLARACQEAVAAAARHATAERAAAEIHAELGRTARRLRALQQRWIPQHEDALTRLDLMLDESQREQSVRVRWLTGHSLARAPGPMP